jgi:hypothetical protein
MKLGLNPVFEACRVCLKSYDACRKCLVYLKANTVCDGCGGLLAVFPLTTVKHKLHVCSSCLARLT